LIVIVINVVSLKCFDTVGWASGRAVACKKLSYMVLEWLSVWMKVQMVCIYTVSQKKIRQYNIVHNFG